MREHLWKVNNGFTLVEVILSIAILAIISIPLLNYFSNSIRYSALMAEKEQATILAQKLIEEMEAEETLIQDDYTIPFLTGTKGYMADLTHQLSSTDGTGTAIFSGVEDGKYDVIVTVSTSTPVNSTTHPVIYGIDDTQDVLAVEKEQRNEAAIYFMSINSSYSSMAGVASLSADEIKNRMVRTIHIDIGMDGSNYTVKVYYTYVCSDLKGAGSSNAYTSSNLLDGKIAKLETIYLLYDRTDHGTAGDVDTIEMNASPEAIAAGVNPDLYLVCQNTRNDGSYVLQVNRLDVSEKIHTNVSNTIPGADATGIVKDQTGLPVTTEELTGEEQIVRLVSLKVEVYKKNHRASDSAYAVMETTKGEQP